MHFHRLKASGRLKTTCLGYQWEREAPAELGFGSAGASPSRYNGNCRSPKGPLVQLESPSLVAAVLAFEGLEENSPITFAHRRELQRVALFDNGQHTASSDIEAHRDRSRQAPNST